MGKHTPPLVRKIFSRGHIRGKIFSYLAAQDIASLRQTSSRIRKEITPTVFRTLKVTFQALTFHPERVRALGRIGHHVKIFRFVFPHSEETYMPPMLDPETKELISLVYEPSIRNGDLKGASKFGNKMMDALALNNYGIILMSALDSHQFTKCFLSMKNLRTIIISCPGIPLGEPGRRCIVDFALLSLRTAIERSRPPRLRAIHFDPVHLSGVQHLLPGEFSPMRTSTNSPRVWNQIKKLTLKISAWVPLASGQGTQLEYWTHMRFLHRFLENFPTVKNLSFGWTRESRGICPLTLDAMPYMSPNQHGGPSVIVDRPLKFSKLHNLKLENVAVDSRAFKLFLGRHTTGFREWNLDDVYFASGTLEDALEPLRILPDNAIETSSETSLAQPEVQACHVVSFQNLFEDCSFSLDEGIVLVS